MNDSIMQGLILAVVVIVMYFVPTGIAKGKKQFWGVFFLNTFLGFTVLGWILCFIWAFAGERVVKVAKA